MLFDTKGPVTTLSQFGVLSDTTGQVDDLVASRSVLVGRCRNDLVEGFILANHPKIASRALLRCFPALLQVDDFGFQRLIPDREIVIQVLLGQNSVSKIAGLAVAINRKPQLYLHAYSRNGQSGNNPAQADQIVPRVSCFQVSFCQCAVLSIDSDRKRRTTGV